MVPAAVWGKAAEGVSATERATPEARTRSPRSTSLGSLKSTSTTAPASPSLA